MQLSRHKAAIQCHHKQKEGRLTDRWQRTPGVGGEQKGTNRQLTNTKPSLLFPYMIEDRKTKCTPLPRHTTEETIAVNYYFAHSQSRQSNYPTVWDPMPTILRPTVWDRTCQQLRPTVWATSKRTTPSTDVGNISGDFKLHSNLCCKFIATDVASS